MPAERIDGIKYHLDREPVEVLEGIRGHLLDRHRTLVGEIERVTGELAVRGVVPPLPEDVPEAPVFSNEDLLRVDL